MIVDARHLIESLPEASFEAVYCSHMLEHVAAHEVPAVLGGIAWVLVPGGHVEVRVPDIKAIADAVAIQGRDLTTAAYGSPAGPVTFLDMLYGFGPEIAAGGELYAHRTGFTLPTLRAALAAAGFDEIEVIAQNFELWATARKGTE